VVPSAPSPDVRILMRFGDERREALVELPQRFSITGAADPAAFLPPRPVLAAGGEAARPGDAGVVVWAEGRRRGAGGGWQIAAAGSGLRDGRLPLPPEIASEGAATLATEAPGCAALAPPLASETRRDIPDRAPAAARDRPRPPVVDPLLQAMRRNE
jgi:hypothetical protein